MYDWVLDTLASYLSVTVNLFSFLFTKVIFLIIFLLMEGLTAFQNLSEKEFQTRQKNRKMLFLIIKNKHRRRGPPTFKRQTCSKITSLTKKLPRHYQHAQNQLNL